MAFRSDKPHDHCGVFGIYGHPQAATTTYYGLTALQHRGQEGTGIVSSHYDSAAGRHRFFVHKDFGLVNDVFRDDTILTTQLRGQAAIGHNRYSTAGAAENRNNIQPLVVNYRGGHLAISHNGNLSNFGSIHRRLQQDGTIFQTTSDTEIILHLIARSKAEDQIHQILDALNQVEGAFSLTILTDDKLIAARDPHGWRPLCFGKLNGAFVVASETCAFDIMNAEYLDEVKPGEVLVFDADTVRTGEAKSYHLKGKPPRPHFCIFEFIYFSRPDSKIFGENVDKVRRRLGKALARQHPVSADDENERILVINVPDSSNTATLGFATENSKLGNPSKYEIGLIRSHYIGRTFIQPQEDIRELRVKMKFNTVKGVLKGKRIVVVDDSIVRGTTSKMLVRLLHEAEPKEIHFRVSSPPIRYPCHYGMDFPRPNELIANRLDGNTAMIQRELGVDSLGYLSLENLLASVPTEGGQSYCTACFSGEYPTDVEADVSKDVFDI